MLRPHCHRSRSPAPRPALPGNRVGVVDERWFETTVDPTGPRRFTLNATSDGCKLCRPARCKGYGIGQIARRTRDTVPVLRARISTLRRPVSRRRARRSPNLAHLTWLDGLRTQLVFPPQSRRSPNR
jgi:hypothetical protein